MQQGATKGIQRAVHRRSNCAANTNGAPADPIAALTRINRRASTMSLIASLVLALDSASIQQPRLFTPGSSYTAYQNRFKLPTPNRRGRTRDRFRGRRFNSQNAAISSELGFLSSRLGRVNNFLKRNIVFRCPGTSRHTIPGCRRASCATTSVLITCPGNRRNMTICPTFWSSSLSDDQKAIGMIHEVFHMVYRYGDRDRSPFANTFRKRRREPECYASLVADISGVTPFDPSCPI